MAEYLLYAGRVRGCGWLSLWRKGMLMPFLFCCSHMFHGHIKYIVRIFSYICDCHPGEKYRRRKAILCFYPKSRNLENFNLRRDKRHGIVLAMICIRLRLTAYRQGIKLCPYSSTVFQSQRFDMGQKRSLAFLYAAVSGTWRHDITKSIKVNQS